jgi:hypothetical protein
MHIINNNLRLGGVLCTERTVNKSNKKEECFIVRVLNGGKCGKKIRENETEKSLMRRVCDY